MRGLNFADGVTTLTDFTASIIGDELSLSIKNSKQNIQDILLCGGGRKNKILLKKIQENLPSNINLKLVDDYKINGDFISLKHLLF